MNKHGGKQACIINLCSRSSCHRTSHYIDEWEICAGKELRMRVRGIANAREARGPQWRPRTQDHKSASTGLNTTIRARFGNAYSATLRALYPNGDRWQRQGPNRSTVTMQVSSNMLWCQNGQGRLGLCQTANLNSARPRCVGHRAQIMRQQCWNMLVTAQVSTTKGILELTSVGHLQGREVDRDGSPPMMSCLPAQLKPPL